MDSNCGMLYANYSINDNRIVTRIQVEQTKGNPSYHVRTLGINCKIIWSVSLESVYNIQYTEVIAKSCIKIQMNGSTVIETICYNTLGEQKHLINWPLFNPMKFIPKTSAAFWNFNLLNYLNSTAEKVFHIN